MTKEERVLVITLLTDYLNTKPKKLLTREEYRMVENVIKKLFKED